jgi:hypothetical protein
LLRGIYGPNGDEIIRGGRKLHNKGLYNLYLSPNIIRMIKSTWIVWAGQRERTAYRGLVENPEGKTKLGRPRHA